MKIKDVIRYLRKIEKSNGNLPVCITYLPDYCYTVNEMDIDEITSIRVEDIHKEAYVFLSV